MTLDDRIHIFEAKIEEYYLSSIPGICDLSDKSFFEEWPIRKFCIYTLFKALKSKVDSAVHARLVDKLIDIKLHYSYLDTTHQHFYRGPTLIVGNNEIEKLNPNTIALLRENHYKVCLISLLTEQMLDLLELILTSKASDPKNNKWGKRISLIKTRTGDAILTEAEGKKLLSFRDRYRTAEFHKNSTVRAFTSKKQWNHFQTEVDVLKRVLARIHSYFCNLT